MTLPVRDQEDRRDWKEGDDLVIDMPSTGIENITFIIDEIELQPENGLLISAFEQGDENPYDFLAYDAFDQNPDDEILPDIETGDILVPQVSNVQRRTKKNDFNIDTIVFDVETIDSDYNYWLEVQYKAGKDDYNFDEETITDIALAALRVAFDVRL